jgi:DNA-binding response OmpR family regulator
MVWDELSRLRLTQAVVHQILVVEDDADTAAFIKTFLETHGYQVTIAKDGGQAHSSFVMRKPDFVILDLILPGESGFQICERFKQSDKAIPVLILSAIELEDSKDLAQRVGCDGYLTKPFEPPVLLAKIKEVSERVWGRYHSEQPEKDSYVRFYCKCGKKFKVSQTHRGKSLTCPECGESVVVPRHD